jgi:hypothetical protein
MSRQEMDRQEHEVAKMGGKSGDRDMQQRKDRRWNSQNLRVLKLVNPLSRPKYLKDFFHRSTKSNMIIVRLYL